MSANDALHRLVATMATLRGPDGCPWDAEQTHESLVPYVLEEVYELIEALESGSPEDVKEELGDVLYQVLFHADIAAHATNSPFTIDDVAAAVDEKMRVRHPHVFAEGDAKSVDDEIHVLLNCELYIDLRYDLLQHMSELNPEFYTLPCLTKFCMILTTSSVQNILAKYLVFNAQ